jgi:hypothetical protein
MFTIINNPNRVMKKTFIIFIFSALAFSISAQDTTSVAGPWKSKGMAGLNFSQVSLTNWAQGGESSYAMNLLSAFSLDYASGNSSWANSFDAGYGIQKIGDKEAGKTDDHIEIATRYGYKTSNNWNITGMLNLKSQFTKGYKLTTTDRILISDFMSPGYILLSVGMEYKPGDSFYASLSPVAGKMTVVMNDSLSAVGSFGVKPGENIRSEFGGSVKIGLNKEIMKNVSLTTTLDLFSNYIDTPQNIDVSWKMLINMKVNEFLSANISTHLLYDDDINYTDGEGVNQGPRVQFKEIIGVGFSVKF